TSRGNTPRQTLTWIAACAVGAAGALALFLFNPWARLAMLVLLAISAAFAARFLSRVPTEEEEEEDEEASPRHLVVDEQGIVFEPSRGPGQQLLAFGRPFGITLFGNRARNRLAMAMTMNDRTVYFGARVLPEDRQGHRALLSWATTVSDDEAVLDAAGPDGQPLELRTRDVAALVDALLRADARALDRCFLSDTRGAPVVLDGNDLRVGRKGFDLGAPLEWRATLFQEPFGVLTGANDWDASAAPCGGV